MVAGKPHTGSGMHWRKERGGAALSGRRAFLHIRIRICIRNAIFDSGRPVLPWIRLPGFQDEIIVKIAEATLSACRASAAFHNACRVSIENRFQRVPHLLYACTTAPLHHCTSLPSHCDHCTTLYCTSAPLRHCTTAPLRHCDHCDHWTTAPLLLSH